MSEEFKEVTEEIQNAEVTGESLGEADDAENVIGADENEFAAAAGEYSEPKKTGQVGAYLYGLLVILVLVIAQSAIQMIGLYPIMQRCLAASGGDVDKYQQLYLAEIASSPAVQFSTLFGSLFMLIIAAVWYFFKYYRPAKEEGRIEPLLPRLKKPMAIVTIVAGCICAFGLAVVIQCLLSGFIPDTSEMVNELLGDVIGTNIMGVIAAVIVAPIAEELAVRGIILRRAERSFGLVGCMIISAVMFGVFHLNIIQGLYVLPMGLFWGYIGYKYKSVIPCIICHMLNNLFSVVTGGIDIHSLSTILIFLGVAIVSGAVTFLMIKKENSANAEELTETVG